MANIIKQLKQGEDVVLPITHEDAVIDSAGVSIKDKIDALAELIRDNTGGKELVHEVEVWADYECTTRPTGEVNHVYVQLNRDFKFDECTNYGTSTPSGSTELTIYTPTPEDSTNPYTINCWIDFQSVVEQTSYLTAGQVLLCVYPGPPESPKLDVTGYQTSFGELIPKPEIQRYRGVISNVSNVPLPTLLVGYSKFAVNRKKDYDGELIYKLSGAYDYCLEQANEGVYIPIGRVLIGKQERINISSEDSTYAWRTLVIKRQSGSYNFALGIHPDECSEGYGTYDILEEGSVIYSTGNTQIYVINVLFEGEYEFNIEAIEIYAFKEVPYNLVITGVPELPTVSGNIRNVTIDTTAYGELTADQLVSKLNIRSYNTETECEVVNDYIDVIDIESSDSLFKISKSSTPTIWEVECLLPAGAGPEIAVFEPCTESYAPIYNDGREE